MTTDYALIDEPTPGPLREYVVRPFWVFLALLVGGAWLAFPWFVFNAHAMGSPTKSREIGVAAGYFVLATLFAGLIVVGSAIGVPPAVVRYALLGVVVIKLTMAFWVVTLQSRTFALYAEFGSVYPHPALIIVIAWSLRGLFHLEASNGVLQVIWAVLS